MRGFPLLLQNARRKKLTDQEAREVIQSRCAIDSQGRDPLHLSMQRQWYVNSAYYLGVSSIESLEALLEVAPADVVLEENFKANHIFRTVMQQVARISSSPPGYDVIPNSPDPDDQFGAKVARHFVEHFSEENRDEQTRLMIAFYISLWGDGFWRSDWDAMAGREIRTVTNPFNGQPVSSPNLSEEAIEFAERAGAVDSRMEGDLEDEALSPFQMIVPRGFRTMDQMPWLMFEVERSLDWVWDHYPNKAKQLSVHDLENHADGHFWKRLAGLVGRAQFTLSTTGSDQNEALRIFEFWKPPSKMWPNGYWIRSTKETVLDHGPHPYHDAGIDVRTKSWMRYPFEHIQYAPMPGRFWGVSLVEHLVALQRDYDRARNQSIQQRDRLAHPQIIKQKGTLLKPLRNEYGDVWEYDGMSKPDVIPPPPMSQMHVESMERSLSDMRAISAQGEASQGDVPPGLRSGVAIRYLQERDISSLASTIRSYEKAIGRVYQRRLTLIHRFLDIPRGIRIYGEYRQADVGIFKGEDLFGNVNVRIKAGSMMPKSKAETAELMIELLTLGVFDPANPRHQEIVLSAFEVGGAEKLFALRNSDRRRAEIENYMFGRANQGPNGVPAVFPDVDDDDDHETHLDEHLLFKKSDEYELLPPIIRAAFDAHLFKHKQALMMQMQGWPPEPGKAPAAPVEARRPPRRARPASRRGRTRRPAPSEDRPHEQAEERRADADRGGDGPGAPTGPRAGSRAAAGEGSRARSGCARCRAEAGQHPARARGHRRPDAGRAPQARAHRRRGARQRRHRRGRGLGLPLRDLQQHRPRVRRLALREQRWPRARPAALERGDHQPAVEAAAAASSGREPAAPALPALHDQVPPDRRPDDRGEARRADQILGGGPGPLDGRGEEGSPARPRQRHADRRGPGRQPARDLGGQQRASAALAARRPAPARARRVP